MRNIPVFTTEFGVASLILKEIPYSQTAYIRIQSSLDPEALLQECVGFCRAAGAEFICATGHDILNQYPIQSRVLKMEILRTVLADTEAEAVPVTAETLSSWRESYNSLMVSVDNASYMTELDSKQMLQREDGYFVYRDNAPIGILMTSGCKLDAVASLVPGGGKDSVLAAKKILTSEKVELEVADTNFAAIRLYERLGFTHTGTAAVWYKIL